MAEDVKYFDYLATCAHRIEDALGLADIERRVSHWRTYGLGDVEGISTGCRNIIEKSLKSLLGYSVEEKIDLWYVIELAEKKGIIPHRIFVKCERIRKLGNDGAHKSVKAHEAKESLELLDDFFRWFVGERFPDAGFPSFTSRCTDQLIMTMPKRRTEELVKKAAIASSLSGSKEAERIAFEAKEQAKTAENDFDAWLASMTDVVSKLNEGSQLHGNDPEKAEKFAQAKKSVLEACDLQYEEVMNGREEAIETIDEAEARIDEILGEYDYIRSLLEEDGVATLEQLEVLAFPKKTKGVKSTVLKISGAAGSGKTLCLLAKLLRQVEADRAMMKRGSEKKALFVCFNKTLAEYINRLLNECSRDFPYAKQRITVRSFDQFINALVKFKPANSEEFRDAAMDVRIDEPRWNIHYESAGGSGASLQLTHRAMQSVSARYSEKAGAYYLDDADSKNVVWVADEIRYLEAKYGLPEQAKGYTDMESRLGRGGTHRPDAEIRAIILQVWQSYYELLASKRKYTIDQALHRLAKSNELPQFDAVVVDECQDLSSLAIRVLYKMRKDEPGCFMYVAGDENQKIFQRDFSWKALDEHAQCHGIKLKQNKRNAKQIAAFASRLVDEEAAQMPEGQSVRVGSMSREEVAEVVASALEQGDTVAIIGGPLSRSKKGMPKSRNLFQVGELSSKGLEFDVVVVDYDRMFADTMEEEERLRYVHFTRARKQLYVRWSDQVPELMSLHYPDFLLDAD